MPRRLVTLLLLMVLAACGSGHGPAPARAEGNRVAGEYLVQADPALDASALRSRFRAYGVQGVTALGPGRWQVRLERDPGPAVLAELAAGDPAIHIVQPNYRYRQQPRPVR